jgi:hypothetical protein
MYYATTKRNAFIFSYYFTISLPQLLENMKFSWIDINRWEGELEESKDECINVHLEVRNLMVIPYTSK